MQAKGHIAEKADLLEPTAALITNIAAVHLQTTGSVAEVARNKAELIAALPPAAVCVVPSNEPLLDPYLRDDLTTIRHGDGGDFSLRSFRAGVASIDCAGETITVRPGFSQPHNLANLVAAIALLGGLGLGPPTEPEFVRRCAGRSSASTGWSWCSTASTLARRLWAPLSKHLRPNRRSDGSPSWLHLRSWDHGVAPTIERQEQRQHG